MIVIDYKRFQIWYAALYRECLAGAQIIFPESGRGLGHVTPYSYWQYGRLSERQLGFLSVCVTVDMSRPFQWYLNIVTRNMTDVSRQL